MIVLCVTYTLNILFVYSIHLKRSFNTSNIYYVYCAALRTQMKNVKHTSNTHCDCFRANYCKPLTLCTLLHLVKLQQMWLQNVNYPRGDTCSACVFVPTGATTTQYEICKQRRVPLA